MITSLPDELLDKFHKTFSELWLFANLGFIQIRNNFLGYSTLQRLYVPDAIGLYDEVLINKAEEVSSESKFDQRKLTENVRK